MKNAVKLRYGLVARIIPIVIVLCSTHLLEAAGFLGASYEDCVADFGQPVTHDYGFGGDMYTFEKNEWRYGVVFQDRVVASIMYMKIDSSPVGLTDVQLIKDVYSDGLGWLEQGKKLVRSDHQVYLESRLTAVLVYTRAFRRSAR